MVLMRFYGTTIGKKIVMAVTGLILVGFVVGHMAGNLKFFGGVDPATGVHKIDHYAEFLRSIGADLVGRETVLWIARVGLLVAVVLHFISAFPLAKLNRQAKPQGYVVASYRSSSAASRTMLYGGVFLLLFIVFHILHFTTGHVHLHGFEHGAVYNNLMSGFSVWWTVVIYLAAMAFLSLHIYHGVWSMFQTLGVDNPRWNYGVRSAAKFLAVLLFVGFSAVPVSAALRLLPPTVAQFSGEGR